MTHTTIITPVCTICGRDGLATITEAERAALERGDYIQHALPERAPGFREQVKSGTHPECWARMFGALDEDER